MFAETEKCKRCGACFAECPYQLIVEDKEGFPKLRLAAKKTCIACGHCVAVCPVSALTLPDLPVTESLAPEQCPPVLKDLRIEREQAEQFLRSRRSVREYRAKPLPEALISELLTLSTFAPSAKNGQPARWIVTRTPAATRELAEHTVDFMAINNVFPGVIKNWEKGIDKILHGAPHVAIAHASEDGFHPAEDCSLAAAYLELGAHAHGVGACWAGFLMEAAEGYHPLRESLGIPEGHGVYAALMLGYPRYRYPRIPRRRAADIRWLG
ncbi:nitroreductase family protein [Pseudodesulfovibrio piezophilus]|uniref:Nitroreductase n=1 Tax=Pseudodesulfovibrio piezophilus (strain DSM 21447 / JCM 15486 / C1TLV30) TaxID=1322246 RepID=M1WMI4_PSEP2|nr:nitroreductase family protein [Pseudodesulfovibrio piezophilus]CCH49660.1 Nitroreductase [Pseudodesulfovibrio piezophilus C1TLV30]